MKILDGVSRPKGTIICIVKIAEEQDSRVNPVVSVCQWSGKAEEGIFLMET